MSNIFFVKQKNLSFAESGVVLFLGNSDFDQCFDFSVLQDNEKVVHTLHQLWWTLEFRF